MRLVVDINLMVRAVRSAGPARRFFKLAPLQHTIIYHYEQFGELRDVARRPRLKIDPVAVEELLERLGRYGLRVETPLDAVQDCRDPKDNYLLAVADAGRAEMILSEDLDLLVLNPWRGIRILRLVHFLDQFSLKEPPVT